MIREAVILLLHKRLSFLTSALYLLFVYSNISIFSSHFEMSMKLIKLNNNGLSIVTEFLLPGCLQITMGLLTPSVLKHEGFFPLEATPRFCVCGGGEGVPMRRAHGITSL